MCTDIYFFYLNINYSVYILIIILKKKAISFEIIKKVFIPYFYFLISLLLLLYFIPSCIYNNVAITFYKKILYKFLLIPECHRISLIFT